MSDYFAWTDPRVETLKRMWVNGLSARQIATELGAVSRNSIIGKVHRLGLSGRKASPARSERKNGQRVIVRPKSRYEVQIVTDGQLSREATDIPATQRKALIELTNETCRWPVGDPGAADFFFCGALEADFAARVPYCRFHAALACGRIRAPAIAPGKAAA